MNHKSRSTTPFVVIVILIALILLPHNAAATSQDQVDRIEELEARLAALESAAAGAPTVVTYQGYLTDAGGSPLNDVVDLHFRIYTAESDGTMVWEETHADVTVTDGYFSVLLGSAGSPLGASVFNGTARWMQVGVDSAPSLPRHRVAAVPYALQAQEAASVPWSGITGVPGYVYVPATSALTHTSLHGDPVSAGTYIVGPSGDTGADYTFDYPASAKALTVRLSSRWSSASGAYYNVLCPTAETGGDCYLLTRAIVANFPVADSGVVHLDENGRFRMLISQSTEATYVMVLGYFE